MSSNSKTLASKVVNAFQALLDSDVRDAIDENHFHALHEMVSAAITEQSEAILKQLEQDLLQIKSDLVERRPLEL